MAGAVHPYRMAWSFRIGRVFDIDIRVHLIFIVFVAVLCLQAVFETGSVQIALHYLFRILLLFSFVLMHELGHSVMAQRAGIQVIDIVLWPLGGLARLKGENRKPSTEFKVAIAGPAVNLSLALILFLPLIYFGEMRPGTLLCDIWAMNLALGTFNLIPAFPMDGGRILRALLARKRSYLKATELAVRVGRIIAWICIFLAILHWNNYWIVIICLFVLWAGSSELRMVRTREMMKAAGFWRQAQQESTIIDAEVVSGSAEEQAEDSHPHRTAAELQDFERQFIDMIKKYRKDGEP